MEMAEMRSRATALVRDGALGYDQKLRRLAALATEAIEYPAVSPACREALDKRVICDLYEGNAPYTPRVKLIGFRKHGVRPASHPLGEPTQTRCRRMETSLRSTSRSACA